MTLTCSQLEWWMGCLHTYMLFILPALLPPLLFILIANHICHHPWVTGLHQDCSSALAICCSPSSGHPLVILWSFSHPLGILRSYSDYPFLILSIHWLCRGHHQVIRLLSSQDACILWPFFGSHFAVASSHCALLILWNYSLSCSFFYFLSFFPLFWFSFPFLGLPCLSSYFSLSLCAISL